MRRRDEIQREFARAAPSFEERTQGRFDDLDVVAFAGARRDATVLEVGCGTGNFLRRFAPVASLLVGVDLTAEMLARAPAHGVVPVQADAFRLPFAAASFDLVASAQALHHIHHPVPVVQEMRRVVRRHGRVLIVDQLGPESYEQLAFMNRLEVLRDPSHASSRPRSAFAIIVRAAGLEIVDERVHEVRNRLSGWMWPGEFPEDRIAAVRAFIERFGDETGMEFEREGDDWSFTRRRIMLLARRAP